MLREQQLQQEIDEEEERYESGQVVGIIPID